MLMQLTDEVRPIVHRELRLVVEGRVDVAVVRVAVLAADGKDFDPVVGDERRGDVVLGGQRVRGAQDDVRADRPRGSGRGSPSRP